MEQLAREVLASYNYREIRLPLFEETGLFARSVGSDTDIVQKEMYYVVSPTLASLREWRDRLLAQKVTDLQDQDQLFKYIFRFEFFFEGLKRAYSDEEIPHTQEHERALSLLGKQIDRWRPDKRGRISPSAQEWKKYDSTIKENLQELDLELEMSLRPEATASVVRAYIQNRLYLQPGLVKLYLIGPMFRRERPQKGRYRQFYQINAEVLGKSDHPGIDAEVIETVLVFLNRCGLRSCTLQVNSIGCSNCRPDYVQKLKRQLAKVRAKLGPDSQRRIETNPLRVLDSKFPDEQTVIEKLPSILDHLCAACRKHFALFQQELQARNIAYEINWRLVRGLDYYMRTAFEITAPGLGAQNAILGGGRYDGLSELLGGPPAKGIGWALGTDRFLLALQQTTEARPADALDVFIAWLGDAACREALRLARTLRKKNCRVEMAYEETKLRKSLDLANKLRARYTLILGDDELKQGKLTLREMATGQQRLLTEAEVMASVAPASGQ